MAASAAESITTKTAQLNLGEDTDDDDDPFTSDVETDLEEDKAVIEDE